MAEFSVIGKIISQARNLSDTDHQNFCTNLLSSLPTSSIPECSSALRHLYTVIHSTDERRELPAKLLEMLVSIMLSQDRARLAPRLAASLILSERGPGTLADLPTGHPSWNETQIPYAVPTYIMTGTEKDVLSILAPQLIRWVSTVGFNAEVQSCALSAVAALVQAHPNTLNKSHLHVVDCQLGEWLRSASLQQAPNPYSRTLFKREEGTPVTELDGQPARNLFTALCVGQYYTDDQLLNIHSFALLQHWLLHTRHVVPYGPPAAAISADGGEVVIDGRSDASGSTGTREDADGHAPTDSSSMSRSPSSGGHSRVTEDSQDAPADGSQVEEVSSEARVRLRSRDPSPTPSLVPFPLEESALQYAIRIIDQWDRKAKVAQDAEVQKACVIESVGILNQLCQSDPSLIPRVFEVVKRLHRKVSHTVHPRVLVPIMQFYLNFSEIVMFDAFPLYELYLGQVVSMFYAHPAIAFDTIMFVQDNKENLMMKTGLFKKFFPNLFKILAWNPHAFITEFVELLPAFLSPSTAVEVFHTLLDLPLLSAALEVTKRSEATDQNPTQLPGGHLVEKLREPRYKPFFKFILRAEGGKGDTIDRLETLHHLLSDLANHPRVVTCADSVPVLLRIYFEVVLTEGGPVLASTLLPVILERSRLLFRIPEFQTAIHRVFSDQVVALFRRYPSLVMDQFSDLLDHVGSIRNVTHNEDFYVHVVWLVGEYLCSQYDTRCTPDRTAAMLEALETVAYELCGRQTATPPGGAAANYSARLLTGMMSALAKLASRSQDLIPRVLLCLTKLGQAGQLDDTGRQAVSERAAELVSLLQVPNIAAMVLSPHPDRELGTWHTQNTSLLAVLHATAAMLQTSQAPVVKT